LPKRTILSRHRKQVRAIASGGFYDPPPYSSAPADHDHILTCQWNLHHRLMRYLVKARVKPGREKDLLNAIGDRSLGRGSVPTPLAEERPYWEQYFELLAVKDAHARRHCRDWNGTEPWACCECDCTRKLEAKPQSRGNSFIESLQRRY
jgi:hypothetical protein